jgi:hypothetical protein
MFVVQYALPPPEEVTVSCVGNVLCVGGRSGPEAFCDWRFVMNVDEHRAAENLQEVSVFGNITDLPGVAIVCQTATRTQAWTMHYPSTVSIVTTPSAAIVFVARPTVFPHAGTERNYVAIRDDPEDPEGRRYLVARADLNKTLQPLPTRWDPRAAVWVEHPGANYWNLADPLPMSLTGQKVDAATAERSLLRGLVPHLYTADYDWDVGESSFWWSDPATKMRHTIVRAAAPNEMSRVPNVLRTWSTYSHVDHCRGVVYALVHCCHMHGHHFRLDNEDDHHTESISVWCCQLTAVLSPTQTSSGDIPSLRLQASHILMDGVSTSQPTTEGEWTRVSVIQNQTCVCADSHCTSCVKFYRYTRTGTFADGRIYMTDGSHYVAQLRPDIDSAWSHFENAWFSTALGFPTVVESRCRVMRP